MDLQRKKKKPLSHLYLLAQVSHPLCSQKEGGLYCTSTFKDSLELFTYLPTVRGGLWGEEDQSMAWRCPLRQSRGSCEGGVGGQGGEGKGGGSRKAEWL